jgi:hypothetical protein
MLETVMFNRLNQQLQANNILVPEQFGYRKGITTEKAIFTVTDIICTALNQRMQVGGIFCDLAKVFDCVNHKIILGKLFNYGIHGVNTQWFESYFTNSKQKVDIISQDHQQKLLSNWGTIICGVPHGSILG